VEICFGQLSYSRTPFSSRDCLGPANKEGAEQEKPHFATMASSAKVKADGKAVKVQEEEAHGYEFLGP
jgi:hypothetical protein